VAPNATINATGAQRSASTTSASSPTGASCASSSTLRSQANATASGNIIAASTALASHGAASTNSQQLMAQGIELLVQAARGNRPLVTSSTLANVGSGGSTTAPRQSHPGSVGAGEMVAALVARLHMEGLFTLSDSDDVMLQTSRFASSTFGCM
jgi:hypothetical protein